MLHESVLLEETISNLITNKNGSYFDGTAGFGGHTAALANGLYSSSKIISTDKDQIAFRHCTEKFSDDERITVFNTSFVNIKVLSKIESVAGFDGVMADLGVSSFQFDDIDEGFSYRENSPLDMRMDKSGGKTAADILNNYGEKDIANILYQFGEEKKSRQIARRIIEKRNNSPFESSDQLKDLLAEFTPGHMLPKMLSRVFQALRIYVNDELEELKVFINRAVDLLKPGGRICIISFHSLEDRIVKDLFRYETLDCICPPEVPVCICDKEPRLKLITKKPVVPSAEEIKRNKRARSAKLRVAEKL